ncbi:hypothetical protein Poli38472_011841 [Pythium oligandrum]|uniref:Uncharacterized protein n=1 Tax=Pythium oligandrum TaxID=41045 RepID=A0A8K1C8Q0_PYTOL|nr:hypothetical protein Poli38472_011841 [Pythium oligandrum]|eukprot:TMW58253.1 hypothetical protein Poli38472_011841 [Pythium oligandrum]
MNATEWTVLEPFFAVDGGEPATLAAALAWVDDADFEAFTQTPEQALSTSSTASSTSEDGDDTPRELPVKSRKRRQTRRNEIQLLHGMARQLEARLAFLRERAAKGQLAGAAKVNTSTRKTNRMWKHIAANQVKALNESERKNASLRAAVEDQLRLIKDLERFVMKKRRKTLSWSPEYYKLSSGVDPFYDPAVEKEMYESVEEMLSDVDRILADKRMQGDSNEPVNVTEVTSDDQDRPVVESLHTRLFPFAHQAVANALWTMWTAEHVHVINNLRRKDIHVDGDCVRGDLDGEFQLRNATARFRAKMIGRRVIQDDRIVMPAVALIEPVIQVDDNPLSGVYFRLRIWNIFCKTPEDEPATSRVFYSLCTPLTFSEDQAKERRGIGALTNVVLQASRARLNMNNQILENQLLDNFAKLDLSDKS